MSLGGRRLVENDAERLDAEGAASVCTKNAVETHPLEFVCGCSRPIDLAMNVSAGFDQAIPHGMHRVDFASFDFRQGRILEQGDRRVCIASPNRLGQASESTRLTESVARPQLHDRIAQPCLHASIIRARPEIGGGGGWVQGLSHSLALSFTRRPTWPPTQFRQDRARINGRELRGIAQKNDARDRLASPE
jgi:hypothetical protein